MAQVPFFVKRSFASARDLRLTLHQGQHFTIHLKGLGWTQLDNTIAVDYDNSVHGLRLWLQQPAAIPCSTWSRPEGSART